MNRDVEYQPGALTEIAVQGIKQWEDCPNDTFPAIFLDIIFSPHWHLQSSTCFLLMAEQNQGQEKQF